MNKRLFLLIPLLVSAMVYSTSFLTVDKAVWYGSIKFPIDLKSVPPVRVYYAGNKVPSEVDQDNHMVSFTISEYKMKNMFYLIIVDHVNFVSESNTIKYLKIPNGRPYKLYVLTFLPDKGVWEIVQYRLPDDMRIPDNAIIICYHPHLIKSVEGGSALELPRLIFDPELLKHITPEEIHDASIQFLLSSLNSDSIHPMPESQIKPNFERKTILSLQA